MGNLNVFKFEDDPVAGIAAGTLCGLLGIAALVAAAGLAGMRALVLVHVTLVFGGAAFAVGSHRWRPIAVGLAVGGLLPVVAVFVVFWLTWVVNGFVNP